MEKSSVAVGLMPPKNLEALLARVEKTHPDAGAQLRLHFNGMAAQVQMVTEAAEGAARQLAAMDANEPAEAVRKVTRDVPAAALAYLDGGDLWTRVVRGLAKRSTSPTRRWPSSVCSSPTWSR